MISTSLEYTEVVVSRPSAQLKHGVVDPLFIEGHVGVDPCIPGLGAPDTPADETYERVTPVVACHKRPARISL